MEWILDKDALLDEIEITSLGENEAALWNIGQCGVIGKTDSAVFAIDPVLSDLLDNEGNTKRLFEPGLDPEKLRLDTVLCTHIHRDHANLDTLLELLKANPGLQIIAPKSILPALQAGGIPEKNLIGLNQKQTLELHGLKIYPLRTAHPEYTCDENGNDTNLAYVIDTQAGRLLHLGDTYLCDELLDDLNGLKPDVLYAPINGQDYFRTKRGCIGNLSGYEAARTAQIAGAKLTIPTHYDMMKGNTCSPLPFLQEMEENYPQGKKALPGLGERIILRNEKKG